MSIGNNELRSEGRQHSVKVAIRSRRRPPPASSVERPLHTDNETAWTAPADAEGQPRRGASHPQTLPAPTAAASRSSDCSSVPRRSSRSPPFLLKEILDVAIPEGRTGLLSLARPGHDPRRRPHQRLRRAADADLHHRRPARHARPAHRRPRPPPADVPRLLHRTRTGEVQSASPTTSAACRPPSPPRRPPWSPTSPA